jgi:hypothetical protein
MLWISNLSKLRATEIVVVIIQFCLETDRQVALGSAQLVASARSDVVNACDPINSLALQERIGIGHCLQDARACEGAIRQIQLGGQQVTRQTANCILILGTAAVHCVEDLSGRSDVVHRVVAQGLREILDGPRSVRAATATVLGYVLAVCTVPAPLGVGIRQVVLPIAGCQTANAGCGCGCVGGSG